MKENSFKESMRWLHTYSGLIVGWLLFAIFVTGTSAYYKNEITLWMKKEFHHSKANENSLDLATTKAIQSLKNSDKVSVILPNSRSNLIAIKAEKTSMSKKKKSKQRVPYIYYDASTGKMIKDTTKTAGGDFLYRFHFELYKVPREVGRWIVGIATMSMFIAIITGILIHKRIFKDIFTFRAKNNTRGWMDAHILPAVAALPFLIMITYSGLILLTGTIMPWAMKAYFGDDRRAYKQEYTKLYSNNNKEIKTKRAILEKQKQDNKANVYKIVKQNNLKYTNPSNAYTKRIALTKMKKDLNNYGYLNEEESLSKNELLSIIEKANTIWPNNIGYFTITKDKNKNFTVEINPKEPTTIFNYKGQKEAAIYDGKTATLLSTTTPPLIKSDIINTSTAIRALHEIRFANGTYRFIFFIFGILGVIISGTGLILWIQKRKKANKVHKSLGFTIVEKLNLGTIVGIMFAIAVYFIINRVVSIDEASRKEFEINAFFIAWLTSYIYAFIRDTNKAWKEQLLITAVLFLSLPIINAVTVLDSFAELFSRDWMFIYFDIFFIFTALVCLLIRFILIRRERRLA